MDWVARCRSLIKYTYSVIKVAYQEFKTSLFTTSVQKLVYLLLVYRKEYKLLRESYMAYYYGPYSDDVSYCLHVLNQRGYLISQSVPYGTVYRPNPDREEVKLAEDKDCLKLLQSLKSYLGDINDTTRLSELSKTHFLITFYGSLDTDTVVKKSQLLGWKLTKEKVERYTQILKDAGLLKADT